MNIKIFGNLFFKFDSQNLILDHIITCIYGLLKKHILTLIKENEKQINMNSQISYAYDNKIYGKIILELNSTKIEVINKNTQIENYFK